MRTRQTLRRAVGTAAALVVLAAGCSSGHASAHGPLSAPTTTTTTTSAAAVTAAANPKQAAISLGQRMLDQAVLPAGARPSRAPTPSLLRGPELVPGIGNLEFAHRLWTVNKDPRAVYRWLLVHRPRGFVKTTTSSGTSRGVPSWSVEDDLAVNPPNVTAAELQYGIVGGAAGQAVLRVDTIVGWAQPRPADEFVPASDRVAILTVVHLRGVLGKRVATSDPHLVQPIVRAFNRLRVSPPDQVHGCPSIGPRTVSYRVGFATSSTAAPDVVATIGKCGGVGVTVGGRSAPGLGDLSNAAFGNAVARVLGLSEPHFG